MKIIVNLYSLRPKIVIKWGKLILYIPFSIRQIFQADPTVKYYRYPRGGIRVLIMGPISLEHRK